METNLALEPIRYKVTEGRHLVTRAFVYPTGQSFVEVTSRGTLLGWPLFHMTMGKCPETGRRRMARGWVAVGRIATGGLAVGQVAFGILAVAQLSFGLLLALGQGAFGGYRALGQLAASPIAAYGQIAAAGEEAVGQVAIAPYVLAQVGIGSHVYDMRHKDPEARRHFAKWFELWLPESPERP